MEITKEKLESMYNEMTIPILTERLGISRPTLYVLLKENGIPLKGNEGNKKKVRVI